MGSLYFENRFGERKRVAYNIEKKSVNKCILAAIKKMNPTYKVYYTREWSDDEGTWYDVGSHTEFFLFKEDVFGE